MKKIVVKTLHGDRKVKVIKKIGCLAIHKSIGSPEGLTISHIPTGHRVVEISLTTPIKLIKPILKALSKLLKKVKEVPMVQSNEVIRLWKVLRAIDAAYKV